MDYTVDYNVRYDQVNYAIKNRKGKSEFAEEKELEDMDSGDYIKLIDSEAKSRREKRNFKNKRSLSYDMDL